MSLYDDPTDEETQGASPYFPQSSPDQARDEEDTTAGASTSSPYTGDPSVQTAGNADWLTTAPEAQGAAPFSTTPENAPPRSTQQLGTQDVPKIGMSDSERSEASGGTLPRSPKWDEVQRLDEKIDKDTNPGFWGGLARTALALQSPGAYNVLVGGKTAALQKERADLVQQAQYEDNLKGLQPAFRTVIPDRYGGYNTVMVDRMGRQTIIGPAPDPNANAKIRAAGLAAYGAARRAAADKATIDTQGHKWWVNPETHVEEPMPTAEIPGSEEGSIAQDILHPGAQSPYSPPRHYPQPTFPVPNAGGGAGGGWKEATDEQGNVTAFNPATGAQRKLGRIGQGKQEIPREDPNEKRFATAGEAAMQAYMRAPENVPGANSPQDAYAQGYAAAGGGAGGGKKQLPGAVPPKGTTRNRVMADGSKIAYVSDGSKWVPQRKLGRGKPVASH